MCSTPEGIGAGFVPVGRLCPEGQYCAQRPKASARGSFRFAELHHRVVLVLNARRHRRGVRFSAVPAVAPRSASAQRPKASARGSSAGCCSPCRTTPGAQRPKASARGSSCRGAYPGARRACAQRPKASARGSYDCPARVQARQVVLNARRHRRGVRVAEGSCVRALRQCSTPEGIGAGFVALRVERGDCWGNGVGFQGPLAAAAGRGVSRGGFPDSAAIPAGLHRQAPSLSPLSSLLLLFATLGPVSALRLATRAGPRMRGDALAGPPGPTMAKGWGSSVQPST